MAEWLAIIRHVTPTDLADIVLVALFLFVLIDWVRHHVSVRGLAILGLLILIEAFAHHYNLYLAKIMVQICLVLLAIIWLVVFQSDIRRTIDRIAIWGATRRQIDEGSPLIDTLTESVAWMAEHRMGALICLRGIEPWERHIEGGIELHGRVSQPLLISIFSTTTPGHDGAMLIEGDKITRFAAHLPLSSNQSEIAQHGTRHAAALGLAELCDALAIVVSEEHGMISIAHDARLTKVSPGELKAQLETFTAQHMARDRVRPPWWRRPAVPIALVSVALAVIARLTLFYSEPVYRTYAVPIEMRRIPLDLRIVEPPLEVKLTLVGSKNAFRILNPGQLVVHLDLNRLERGVQDFTVSKRNTNLPNSLELVQSDPPVIHIRAEHR